MSKIKVAYIEPADYIPKKLRKEYKLGEYAESNTNEKTPPETLTPKDYDRWGRTCIKFNDDPPKAEPTTNAESDIMEDCGGIKPTVGAQMPDDEELEKLFEQMDRATARMVVNQNSPSEIAPTTFALRLKNARKAAGLTQKEMADIMLIPKRTIEDWERGSREAPPYVQRFVLNELESLKKQ